MIVKSLHMHGFMSHKATEVVLPERGIVLVTGPNGGGKSSLVEAVATAGWGKTLRGTDPWPEGGGSVKVVTDAISATRTCRSDKKRLSWGTNAAGRVHEFETTTKAQEALEAHIGEFEVWRRTHVFSSHDAAHYTMATDGERKRLLEALLGLDRFDPALAACRDDVRRADALLHELRFKLEKSRAVFDAMTSRLVAAKKTLAAIPAVKDMAASVALLHDMKTRAETLIKQREAVVALASAREQVDSARKVVVLAPAGGASDPTAEIARLEGCLRTNQADLKLSRAEQAALTGTLGEYRAGIREADRAIEAVKGAVCDKCGQAIPPSLREEHARKAAALHAKIAADEAEVRQRIQACADDIRDLEDEAEHLNRALTSVRAEAETRSRVAAQQAAALRAVEAAQKRVDFLVAQAGDAQFSTTLDTDILQVTAERDRLQADLATWEATKRQRELAESEMAQVEAQIAELQATISTAEHEEKEASVHVQTLAAVETVLGLKGVRAHVLGRALSGLEAAANSWLAKLVNHDMRLVLRPYSERKSGAISDAISMEVEGAGGGHGYRGASGGERRRIDVALLLALAEVSRAAHGVAAGTLFFDECLDTLDVDGVDAVLRCLDAIAKDRTVVIISHNPDLVQAANAVLRLCVSDGRAIRQ